MEIVPQICFKNIMPQRTSLMLPKPSEAPNKRNSEQVKVNKENQSSLDHSLLHHPQKGLSISNKHNVPKSCRLSTVPLFKNENYQNQVKALEKKQKSGHMNLSGNIMSLPFTRCTSNISH